MKPQTWGDLGIELPHGRVGEVDTTCPQCSPTRKKRAARCLSVNTDRGTWLCHHCGWAGALDGSGSGYGAPLRSRVSMPAPTRVYTVPKSPRPGPLPPRVVEWFAGRGIPEGVLADVGISAGDEFCPACGRHVLTIRFPYVRESALVNIKYRCLEKHFWMVKGARRTLYGFDDLIGTETACLVEGEVDALSIRAAGGPPAVSVPDGAPPPDATHYTSKFAFLDAQALARLQAAKWVLIGADMDAPGERLVVELARRIGLATCKRVSWHPHKDANEMLIAEGPAAVLGALAAAQPFTVPLDDGAVQEGTRPIRMLPPARGRRALIELAPVEVSRAR